MPAIANNSQEILYIFNIAVYHVQILHAKLQLISLCTKQQTTHYTTPI